MGEGLPVPKATKPDVSPVGNETKEAPPQSSYEKLDAVLSTLSPLVREIDEAYAKYEPAAGIRASLNHAKDNLLNSLISLSEARTKNPTLARRFGVPEAGAAKPTPVESQEAAKGSQYERLVALRNALSPLVEKLDATHAKYEPADGIRASLRNSVQLLTNVIGSINGARTVNPTLATRFGAPAV